VLKYLNSHYYHVQIVEIQAQKTHKGVPKEIGIRKHLHFHIFFQKIRTSSTLGEEFII